jgi:hypothetical protein
MKKITLINYAQQDAEPQNKDGRQCLFFDPEDGEDIFPLNVR